MLETQEECKMVTPKEDNRYNELHKVNIFPEIERTSPNLNILVCVLIEDKFITEKNVFIIYMYIYLKICMHWIVRSF